MQIVNDAADTLATFLAELGKALIVNEGMDADLASILSRHLLNAAPTEDCVEQAMMAINVLAANRAAPAKEQMNA